MSIKRALAEALLASDWLAKHERKVAAEALIRRDVTFSLDGEAE